ncbi:MAG: HPF/RaiA family ribosome-associated protein [Phycisphaerales bacterium]|jgi:ribosomal subunit interface protein
MKIQINYGDVEGSEALATRVNQAVESAISRFEDRITRVEVHLRDDKQGRSGPDDNRCTMEARPAGEEPFVVEARHSDLYQAVSDCSLKLKRATTRFFERRSEM